tara:strand:+ start:4608 stop:5519 length:912 start_codon:yes stop_codon:yes gene_type:complete
MLRNRKALIDADVLVYRIGFAGQDAVHSVLDNDGNVLEKFEKKADANDFMELLAMQGCMHPNLTTDILPKSEEDVADMLDTSINKIVELSGSSNYVCYLSGKTNFRTTAAKYQEYKANRKDSVKPVHYAFIRDYIMENHPMILSDNCEADDLLAIDLYREFQKADASDERLDCEVILCTIDKDLRNVPGWHYNIHHREIDWVLPAAADRHFALQLLTGDRVDNIPGLSFYSGGEKKVGPATAKKMIGKAITKSELYSAVCDAYIEFAGDDWHDKLDNSGLLLWMQRDHDEVFSIETWKESLYD